MDNSSFKVNFSGSFIVKQQGFFCEKLIFLLCRYMWWARRMTRKKGPTRDAFEAAKLGHVPQENPETIVRRTYIEWGASLGTPLPANKSLIINRAKHLDQVRTEEAKKIDQYLLQTVGMRPRGTQFLGTPELGWAIARNREQEEKEVEAKARAMANDLLQAASRGAQALSQPQAKAQRPQPVLKGSIPEKDSLRRSRIRPS